MISAIPTDLLWWAATFVMLMAGILAAFAVRVSEGLSVPNARAVSTGIADGFLHPAGTAL